MLFWETDRDFPYIPYLAMAAKPIRVDPTKHLLEILTLGIPAPRRGQRLYIDLVAAHIPPGRPAGGPVCLWVPEASIDHEAEKPGAPWAPIDGSIGSIEKTNKGRAGMARTAAHIVDAKSDLAARSIILLAFLRNIERRRADLAEYARRLMPPLLKASGATSVLELWNSRSAYLLPGEPDGLIEAPVSEMRDIAEPWLREGLLQFRAARVQPRSAKRNSRPSIGSFSLATQGFDDGGRFCVGERSRWQNLTDAELERLVWQRSVSEISREFDVARPVIDRACKRRGIVKPPSWYAKARAHGKDVNERLIAEGYGPVD